MIITFCGHSKYCMDEVSEEDVFKTIEKIANNKEVDFYLGNYGEFDNICYKAVLQYKKKVKKSRAIFVTPYMNNFSKLKSANIKFDEIIYPELEKVPYKLAIIKRNEWMVNQSDYVICFVKYGFGGAVKMLNYAIRKNKKVINLAQ